MRSIIHINITSFAVEVERVCDSSLRGRPVILAHLQSSRSLVYGVSKEAHDEGVRQGMTLGEASLLCRGAHVVRPRLEMYDRAAHTLLKKVQSFLPVVEVPDNRGHLFADVTGCGRLLGGPVDIALRIRKRLRDELSLPSSWSVASNKLVAKVAVRMVNPVGECLVEAGQEASFLAPLSIHLLPGMVAVDLALLHEFNCRLIGEAALLSMPQLMVLFGGRAKYVYGALRGDDSSKVQALARLEDGFRYEHFFSSPVNDRQQIERAFFHLTSQAGQQIRAKRLVARRVGVSLEYKDGVRVVRQASHKAGCCYDTHIFDLARRAFLLAWRRPVGIVRLVLCLDRLTKPTPQYSLFSDVEGRDQRQKRLFDALDRIRVRCGDKGISFGKALI